ncbi:GDSL-type esterase/lipase family protein [Pullulanibacillus sp. KACC 23026]|uniref:GDSL-type esterase/lipase family protein n=1 Tax=Pullulanibacillus sp. KACC 23026 TaxID=3028315 RepID=UPI0023B08B10|nr:GDSL-type esterase/lipase family protein [Pullulanibacillus sp. KACC 23026]WEG13747.1 GDSL-type esterase/lipase family protein [Pullulanibacillus sp. KACC 23026]
MSRLPYPNPSLPIMYTAIGDSLTVGKGSGLFAPGFVERYATELGYLGAHPVLPHKFARIGATSGEILSFTFNPGITYLLADSPIITITSGGNDLIQAGEQFLKTKDIRLIPAAIQQALSNNGRMIQQILDLQKSKHNQGQVYLFNMYNPFPSQPEAEEGIRAYNRALEQLQAYGVKIVDIYHAFQGRTPYLLSRNDVHPNSEGYQVMTDALLNTH